MKRTLLFTNKVTRLYRDTSVTVEAIYPFYQSCRAERNAGFDSYSNLLIFIIALFRKRVKSIDLTHFPIHTVDVLVQFPRSRYQPAVVVVEFLWLVTDTFKRSFLHRGGAKLV